MAVRIRKDGRVLCAAMHPEEPDDTYIDDNLAYILSVEHKVLVTDNEHLKYADGSRGHGEWWWGGQVPEDKKISEFYLE